MDEGDADCICALAMMYEEGKGTKKDLNAALELYHMAADKGNAEAMFLLE